MKSYIKITGLPKIKFAHTFRADSYEGALSRMTGENSFLEVAYIADGELDYSYSDGRTITGTQYSIFCNLHQSSLRTRATQPHEHHTVGFFLPFEIVDETVEGAVCIPEIIELNGQSRPIALIDEIIATHTMHTKGEFSCMGLFFQLLDELDRRSRESIATTPYTYHRYVKKAKKYIFDHLQEPISQTDIAKHLDISPEYLCAVFKSTNDMPIMQFINRVKLEQIRLTIEKNNLTLAQASELYGYSDPNYVSRLHKKYFGYNITDIKKGRFFRE